MTGPLKHPGGGMFFMPELALRKVIMEGLVDMAGDNERMDALFARVDDLLMGTQDDWVAELKSAFVDMATRRDGGGIRVLVGYPADHAFLPCYSVALLNGAESGNEATAADLWDHEATQEGVIHENQDGVRTEFPRLVATETILTPWSSTVQVGAWATSPEASVVLHEVAVAILTKDKGRLHLAGVHGVSLSTPGPFTPDPNRYPMVGYVPLVQVQLSWSRIQFVRKAPTPARISSYSTAPSMGQP